VTGLVTLVSSHTPTLVAAAGDRAAYRFLEFLAANIRNRQTRRAYHRAADEFLGWCASVGVPSIAAAQPVHVAAWIEASTRELAASSVKQIPRGRYSARQLGKGRSDGEPRLSTRATQLYDRRRDEVSLDEIERIVI
jgi:hypothetical protein